uniref:DUF2937 family protein n=1 Tax=Thaumasiovibrio occultus TaxID=1891184 RepID=UPI000B35920A|nr:DUF2937 family protein [Thaumasiovibrio occultus]
MIARLIDKLIFGAALLVALQIPQLADHYQQFLSGLYESTQWQVDGYAETAREHDYATVDDMIVDHLRNESPSVKADAMQKLETLALYNKLGEGMEIFQSRNLFKQTAYMFHPSRIDYLETTLENFTVGIPLTAEGLAFGAGLGLVLNFLLMIPVALWQRQRRLKKINLDRPRNPPKPAPQK